MMVQFSVIQDGSATSVSGLALPTGFPNLQSQQPSTAGTPTSYAGAGPVTTPIYLNALGGTDAATVLTMVPTSGQEAAQLDVTISAAGTSGHTIKVLAIVPDTF